jgi:hypothetical protein
MITSLVINSLLKRTVSVLTARLAYPVNSVIVNFISAKIKKKVLNELSNTP